MSKEVKIKKPIYKKWWVWVLAIILIGAVANPSGESSSEDSKQPASESPAPKAESKPQEEVKAEEPKKEEPKVNPKISKAEFDQLENGMTYEEVVAIIGGEGDVMSEVGEKGTAYYTIMYMYEGEKGIGANANLTFQAGKLNMKAQFGLK